MNTKDKGKKGEDLAFSYLTKKKIKILDRNFKSRYGEIDLIGLNKRTIIFYEVKYREKSNFIDVRYSINKKKKEKILKTAMYYLLLNQIYADYDIRFDAIMIKKNNNQLNISSIENIISADNMKNGNSFFY